MPERTSPPTRKRIAVILVEGVGDDAPEGTMVTTARTLAATCPGYTVGEVAERGEGASIAVSVPAPGGGTRETFRAPFQRMTRRISNRSERVDEIDLIEMQWCDLSRFPKGLWSFFVALFGLGLQVATVGLEASYPNGRPATGGGAQVTPRPITPLTPRRWRLVASAGVALGIAAGACAALVLPAAAAVLIGGALLGVVLLAAAIRAAGSRRGVANRLLEAASWWLAAIVIPLTLVTAVLGIAFWFVTDDTLGLGGAGVALTALGGIVAAHFLGKGLAAGGWVYGGDSWRQPLNPRWWMFVTLGIGYLILVVGWSRDDSLQSGAALALVNVAGFGLRGGWFVTAVLTILVLLALAAARWSTPRIDRHTFLTGVATAVLGPLLVALVGVILIGGIGTLAFASAKDATWGENITDVKCFDDYASWTLGTDCAADIGTDAEWVPTRDGIAATAERSEELATEAEQARRDSVRTEGRRGTELPEALDKEAQRLSTLATSVERDAGATPVDWAKILFKAVTVPLAFILTGFVILGILAAGVVLTGPREPRGRRLSNALAKLTGRGAAGGIAVAGVLAAAWMIAVWTIPQIEQTSLPSTTTAGAGISSAVVLGILAALRFLPVNPKELTKDVGGRLEALRRAVDRGYDVATYLRIDQTGDPVGGVRTRIIARFRELVRRVGRDYDVIIIAAHSQGSMYAIATLFGDRYRRHSEIETGSWGVEPWPAPDRAGVLDGKSVGLLTFGCPLRQTYEARLPGQYAWTKGGLKERTLAPLTLGWTNVYRAGDFIGRAVFATGDNSESPLRQGRGQKRLSSSGGTSVETIDVCLHGRGHHTGYWGDPELSRWIDRFILQAIEDPDADSPPTGYTIVAAAAE